MVRSLSNAAYQSFISGLVGARKAASLSQVQLASRLNLPQSYISKVERLERRLDVMEFCDIARALGLDPGELLERIFRDTPEPP